MENMFGMFELLIGGYVLVQAISGKGKLFQSENIKEGKEKQYKTILRALSFLLGPLMLATGVIDIYSASGNAQSPVMRTLFTALFIASGVLIAAMFAVSIAMTDRSKARENRASAGSAGSARPSAPRAAFEFDEEENDQP